MKAWVSTYSNRPRPSRGLHRSQPWAAPARSELRPGKRPPLARGRRARPTAGAGAPAQPTEFEDESEIPARALAAGRTRARGGT
jgi:hypothetical protein